MVQALTGPPDTGRQAALGRGTPAALGLQAPHSVRQSSPDAQRDLQGLPGQGF